MDNDALCGKYTRSILFGASIAFIVMVISGAEIFDTRPMAVTPLTIDSAKVSTGGSTNPATEALTTPVPDPFTNPASEIAKRLAARAVEGDKLELIRYVDTAHVSNNISFWIIHSTFQLKYATTSKQEKFVADAFRSVFEKEPCGDGDKLVLDFGSNMGYYGLLSLAYGCRAIFADPQPICWQFVEAAILVNGWFDRAYLVPHPISKNTITMHISSESSDFVSESTTAEPCHGMIGIGNEVHIKKTEGRMVEVESINGSEVIGDQEVLILKIDTEGAEISVIESVMDAIQQRRIRNILIEVSPGWWKRVGYSLEEGAAVLRTVMQAGYQMTTRVGKHYIDPQVFYDDFVRQNKGDDVWLSLTT